MTRRPSPGETWDFGRDQALNGRSAARSSSELSERFRRCFERGTPYSVGVEEELLLIDPVTLEPAPVAEGALTAGDSDRRIVAELRSTQIELVTPPHLTPLEVGHSLERLRSDLRLLLEDRATFVAAGAHPISTRPGPITDRPRYRDVAKCCPWADRLTLTCGLHVHVAVPGAERTLAVYNALRSFLPVIAALSVNSPFYSGRDSGMDSVRWKLNGALARSGIPPAFPSWEAYADFVGWASRGGVMADFSYQWWDLRLSPRYGTIEVRIADAQTYIEDSTALVALIQTLVAALAERFDIEGRLPVHPSERIHENAWLAVRDGCNGALVDLESGVSRATNEIASSLVRELEPVARRALGCEQELKSVYRLISETGADRQRRIAAVRGARGLVRWLAAETSGEAGRGEPAQVLRFDEAAGDGERFENRGRTL
jgi:carboxylate-amine ligase